MDETKKVLVIQSIFKIGEDDKQKIKDQMKLVNADYEYFSTEEIDSRFLSEKKD